MKIYKPEINTREEYLAWREIWRRSIKELSSDIRKRKSIVKEKQRKDDLGAGPDQSALHYKRVMASKMHRLLDEVREEGRKRMESEKKIMEDLMKYPLEILKCKNLIFHFNKGHLKNPSIPMWVVKTKGETYYVNHVETSGVSWNTKETPDNPVTKGSLKFKNVQMHVDKDACAYITGI